MDEWTLNDLLECSVCLERLDTSSKVLPCQHTFCRKCLEDIVNTHRELRCPECRVLVECRIDELPPNVLLMRILEGIRNNTAPKKCSGLTSARTQNVHVVPAHQTTQVVPATVQQQPIPASHAQPDHINVHHQIKTPLSYPNQPYARAVYDYQSNEPGDLNFKKGDIILLHQRIDTNWCHGECEGIHGVFPLTYVQVMLPLPSHIPQCKALYDFRMTDEEDGCLRFSKGEIITVIRRIDENWAEGKLGERVGIFPLAFVELNNVARALMKLSSNIQPGPSRVAPPTPTCEDTTPLIPTDHSHSVLKSESFPQRPDPFIISHRQQHVSSSTVTVQRIAGNSDSSSTVSSSSSVTTPNTSSGSSSSTAPSSPTSSPPARTTYSQSTPCPSAIVSTTSPPHPVLKRHSFSVVQSGHHHPSNRHSAEILSPNESAAIHDEQAQVQTNGEMSSRHYRPNCDLNSSSQTAIQPQGSPRVLASAAYLPAAYIALYPYKPQKADELELKKGSIYMVTERCQDGWFKGTSGRTQKCGVFPGNYVTPVKSLPSLQLRVPHGNNSSGPLSPHSSGIHLSDSRHSGPHSPRQRGMLYGIGNLQVPPELPPRSCSPAQPLVSTSWHGQQQPPQTEELVALGRSPSAVVSSDTTPVSGNTSTVITPPANVSVPSSSTSSGRSSEKVKEKKEGKSGLMWRLTSMKKCKSPPPATYSVDNPVFEDSVVTPSSVGHHVHVRSGSCPSQLLQVLPLDANSAHHRLFGTGSQRLKHKERPTIVTTHLASSGRTSEGSGGACAPTSHHRKSNSLDAGSSDLLKKGNKQQQQQQQAVILRERYRCIVAYPPNSDYELELRVGDIIHVHKKRDDGWYKGTQQRTGRTGLFPASFVENF